MATPLDARQTKIRLGPSLWLLLRRFMQGLFEKRLTTLSSSSSDSMLDAEIRNCSHRGHRHRALNIEGKREAKRLNFLILQFV